MEKITQILDIKLFTLAGSDLSAGSIFTAVGVVLAGWILMRGVDRFVMVRLGPRFIEGTGSLTVVRRLLRYVMTAFTWAIALSTMGIDLGALFTAGAIFAVGLGFAMQNIAQNFVAGVILLAERSIKPGDVLKVDGMMVRVEEMGIRCTIARSREEDQMIIPNSLLAQAVVINYNMHDDLLRLRCPVGVVYTADMTEVRKVLEKVGESYKLQSPKRQHLVLLREFGDSAVNWELSIWIENPWDELVHISAVQEAMWVALQEAGITIAYPQLDVHLAPDVESALSQKRSAA